MQPQVPKKKPNLPGLKLGNLGGIMGIGGGGEENKAAQAPPPLKIDKVTPAQLD